MKNVNKETDRGTDRDSSVGKYWKIIKRSREMTGRKE